MSRLDFLAREPHFVDHLAPIWRALPEENRGRFYAVETLRNRAAGLGVEITRFEKMAGDNLTLAASYLDLKHARAAGRRVVLAEHGAGQSYIGVQSGSYIGAIDRAGCVAVLVPGEMHARRHEATHPAIRAYPIGLPKLDHHHASPKPVKRGTVAISFHWDCKVCPETRTALRHYRPALEELARNFDLVGHAHPRIATHMHSVYLKHGIRFERDFDALISQGVELYICDNSSTIYEWASLGRPVVVMNAPWYRRNVEHGLRFWSHADVGLQVDRPEDLLGTVRNALKDPPEVAARRAEVMREIYGVCDGRGAEQAAAVLGELLQAWG